MALSSNSGFYRDDHFIAIPEVGINWFYMLRPRCRFNVGYNFLYISDVWRPGQIMDTGIDPNLLPPATVATADHPQFVAQSDDVWVQGINLGVEFRY